MRTLSAKLLLFGLLSLSAATAMGQGSKPAHRTRLILKDGSYQIVMSYKVEGANVRFVSAERGGDVEEIPVALVDLEATRRWEQSHLPAAEAGEDQAGKPPVLDPELEKEEVERASRTPEVAPDLRLATEDAVLLLDTFQGTPELVPLAQTGSDLNKTTGHSLFRAKLNPLASAHELVQLRGTRAAVQAHVNLPVLYLRIGEDSSAPTGSAPLIVDTSGSHGNATPIPSGGSADSKYVIVRADVRQDIRILTSFKVEGSGSVHRQEDVIETNVENLPGGHWMKLTPKQPLDFGEYALMEVISEREVNLGVWDFGVHPTAPENRDALHPDPRRPVKLGRHGRDEE